MFAVCSRTPPSGCLAATCVVERDIPRLHTEIKTPVMPISFLSDSPPPPPLSLTPPAVPDGQLSISYLTFEHYSDPMLDGLPAELAIALLQEAARLFRDTDRRTVVSLAQTSKAVYKVVAPILYHTMIISTDRANGIREFTYDPTYSALAKRVCSLTRALHVFGAPGEYINPALFTRVEIIQAPFPLVKAIATVAGDACVLKHVDIAFTSFLEGIEDLPVAARRGITHACGYAVDTTNPTIFQEFIEDPARWAARIVDALPALTHFALELVYIALAGYDVVESFDLNAFELVLRTVLAYERIHFLAFRLSGHFRDRVADFLDVALRIKDPRVHMSFDVREKASWAQDDLDNINDACNGRSIWTVTRQVCR